jgi:MFS transporter, DHA3 family, tetracycline resistance protein
LWTKHLIDNFATGFPLQLQPVVWIGGLRAIGMVLSIGAAELARRKIPTGSHVGIARALMAISAVLIAALFGFALARTLGLVLACYWTISMTRSVMGPIYDAWVNQRLDSSVRATVISMSSQVDAIGQITGGPVVGLIGSWFSVRAALVASAVILSPVLVLFRRAIGQPVTELDPSAPPLLQEVDPGE